MIYDNCEQDFCVEKANIGLISMENYLASNIDLSVTQISSDPGFAVYKIAMTDTEIEALKEIKFNASKIARRNENYRNDHFETNSTYGFESSKLLDFFNSVTTNSEIYNIEVVNLISRIFSASIKSNTEDEATLIDVRIAKGDDGYGRTKYWHTDSNFASFKYRNIITLTGPSTVFYNGTNIVDESDYRNWNETANESEVIHPSFGEGVVFDPARAFHASPIEEFDERIYVVIDQADRNSYTNIEGEYCDIKVFAINNSVTYDCAEFAEEE